MLETFGSWVYDMAESALSLLPDSPFLFLKEMAAGDFAEWFHILNWFIPINVFLGILEAWCSAILLYYVVQVVLRWAKAIE